MIYKRARISFTEGKSVQKHLLITKAISFFEKALRFL